MKGIENPRRYAPPTRMFPPAGNCTMPNRMIPDIAGWEKMRIFRETTKRITIPPTK